MRYAIKHVTRFTYDDPISESVMEARMQPRSDARQRCLTFGLQTSPRARVSTYHDADQNTVHYFDILEDHTRLTITANASVEVAAPPALPEALTADAWDSLDALTASDAYWDSLAPSRFAWPSRLLRNLATELGAERGPDPLSTLRMLNHGVHASFVYAPDTTTVDSPIDDALRLRRGVCQDFAHVLIALVRELRVPCRYVSGYLYHRTETSADASPGLADQADAAGGEDASHAWVEAFMPELGWVGFDPTNDSIVGEKHIRVAVGRDYADVPPTHGVYKGSTRSELAVSVHVAPTESGWPV
jgi:transglutaminase-like putative cysteine protease